MTVTDAPAAALSITQVEQFLYREARYADEHDYDAWEALWTDDARYWVPAGDGSDDPGTHVSVIYDNRSRISTRLKQLRTGKRYAQAPPSSLRRLISNVEILGPAGTDTEVGANFIVAEFKPRGTEFWAGRATYRLRVVDDEIRLSYKKVALVNAGDSLPTLAFLI
jgi:benzoate/toluate 1,2-dioxygenase subunit beta